MWKLASLTLATATLLVLPTSWLYAGNAELEGEELRAAEELRVASAARAASVPFDLVFGADPRISSACCDSTNEGDYATCNNSMCNFLSFDEVSAQSTFANLGYSQAVNVLAAEPGLAVKGMVLNGDLTASGLSSQLDTFKEYYEDNLSISVWLGLGDDDYENNTSQDLFEACLANICLNRMVRYLQEHVSQTAADALGIKYLSFDVDEGETYYEVPWERRDITGSFAYSFDIGEFNFIQLHNYPGYATEFSAYNASEARLDQFDIQSSYDWLHSELQQARARRKRSILNYHDHSSTMTDPSFLAAIHDTNVEAIFVGDDRRLVGHVPSQDVTSYYAPRGMYVIPVYYSGSPVWGTLLTVRFDSQVPGARGTSTAGDEAPAAAESFGYPIEVQQWRLQGEPNSPEPVKSGDVQVGLDVAAPYSCAAGATINAALDTRVVPYLSDDLRPVQSTFFAGARMLTVDGVDKTFGVTSDCDATLAEDPVFGLLPAEWQASLDAACWDGGTGETSGAFFFRGAQTAQLRFNLGQDEVTGELIGPTAISTRFLNLPMAFQSDLDAVVRAPAPGDSLYFFKGSEFLIYSTTRREVTLGPRAIASTFQTPGFFQSDLDAVLYALPYQTYLIKGGAYARVDLLTGSYVGTGSIVDWFQIEVPEQVASAVPGESCATAVPIETHRTVPFDNRMAQSDWPFFGACLSGFERDLWYTWQADADGPTAVRIEPGASCSEGLRLGVYSALLLWEFNCGEKAPNGENDVLTAAALNCADAPCGRATSIGFQATAGAVYAIRVAGAAGATGTITVEQSRPLSVVPNDRCADYHVISGFGDVAFEIAGATSDSFPSLSCGLEGQDIWYLWSSPRSAPIRAQVSPDAGSASIIVYEGLPCVTQKPILACVSTVSPDESPGEGPPGGEPPLPTVPKAAEFPATAGKRYAFRILASGGAKDGVLKIEAPADDAFEPNEGCDQAPPLSTGVFSGIALNEDWYRVLVTPSGELRASVDYDATLGTIDVFLHQSCDPDDTPLKHNTGDEFVWMNTATSNTLVYVRLRSGATQPIPYDLNLNVTQNPLDDVFEPNDSCTQLSRITTGLHADLRSNSNDDDWYVVTVPRNGRMNVVLAPSSPDHQLEFFLHSVSDPDGNCPGRFLGLGQRDAGGNLASSAMELLGDQRQVLHVSSRAFTNDYDLDIRVSDRFAGNETCGSGPLLENGGYADLAIDRNRDDWYRVNVPAGGILSVDLDAADASAYPSLSMSLWGACGAAEPLERGIDAPQGKRLSYVNDGAEVELRLSVGLSLPGEETILYRLSVRVDGDCDGDGVPDRTELAAGDCNDNRIPDDCDPDLDGDGLPDDCAPCSDGDGDGVCNADDNCPDSPADVSGVVTDMADVSISDPEDPCTGLGRSLARTITSPRTSLVAGLSLSLDIQHPYIDDLSIQLEHRGEDGTNTGPVTLLKFDEAQGRHGVSTNLNGVYVFDSAAGDTLSGAAFECWIEEPGCTVAPGRYRGFQDLAAFEGIDARGDWILTVQDQDHCHRDDSIPRFLSSWSLDLTLAVNPDQTDSDGDGVGDICAVASQVQFRRGECNDDGSVDISDPVCGLNWLFLGGTTPGCIEALDNNGDGGVDVSDPVWLLNFLFGAGPPPAAPYPDCGAVPSTPLGCIAPPSCDP